MRARTFLLIGIGLLVATAALGAAGAAISRGALGGSGQTIGQAQQSAQAFVDRTGRSGLVLDEILEFQDNFYVRVKESGTDVGAFELLVDRSTGAVAYEPGPDMMWNTKYGPMASRAMGMMGWTLGGGPMTVSAHDASTIAQDWLDRRGGGYTAGTPDSFYGYYTFDYEKGGRIAGMLSVNGYTGQIWYHSWHGAFVTSRELARP